MRVETSSADPGDVDADLLAFAVVDSRPLTAPVDAERFAALAESGELGTSRGDVTLLHRDTRPKRVAAAGVGADPDADAVRTAAAAVARTAASFGGALAWQLDDTLALPLEEQARAVVEGVVLGSYDPGRWKTKPSERKPLERLTLLGAAGLEEVADRAAVVSAWANRARDLANTPPNELTPARLAKRAQEIAAEREGLSAEALGPDEARALGMGSFLAVGQGSVNEPRMIVMRWEPPTAADGVVLGLVGKAITFDSGGISIKPAAKMEDMKGDMAGGGGVIAAMGALAELGVPVRTVAVVASAENLVDGSSFRPGDILTAANGKTIEVINTDAEGRLVLADALWYAREQGATHVIDLATLTGAMELALGDLYAGMFANDDEWRERILEAAKRSGDHTWPFPLHPRYRRYVDSAFADMKNASILRQGSPALAAEFLREFAGDGPWAHVDMAGPGFLERSRGDFLTVPGGTGFGVRLIVELARSFAQEPVSQ
jgi:leucyl aminopeptidase